MESNSWGKGTGKLVLDVIFLLMEDALLELVITISLDIIAGRLMQILRHWFQIHLNQGKIRLNLIITFL